MCLECVKKMTEEIEVCDRIVGHAKKEDPSSIAAKTTIENVSRMRTMLVQAREDVVCKMN